MKPILHLDHVEDLVLQGPQFALEAISILYSPGTFSIKWDGSPALVVGRHNDKPYVATKSAFNKTPKLNFEPKDVFLNHPKIGLQEKLLTAMEHLIPLNLDGHFHGDILFTAKDLTTTFLDKEYVTFSPNTLTYAIPLYSKLGQRVHKSRFGAVFHTEYDGKIDIPEVEKSWIFPTQKLILDVPETPPVLPKDSILEKISQSYSEINIWINSEIRKGNSPDLKEKVGDELANVYNILVERKLRLIKEIPHDGIRIFLPDGKETTHEGLVSPGISKPVKLVNRLQFSYANFKRFQ